MCYQGDQNYSELETKWHAKLQDAFDDFIEKDLVPQFTEDKAILKAIKHLIVKGLLLCSAGGDTK